MTDEQLLSLADVLIKQGDTFESPKYFKRLVDLARIGASVMPRPIEKHVKALEFYANPKHWNEDGQCMTPDEFPAPFWAEADFPIVAGHLDLGDVARSALSALPKPAEVTTWGKMW